MSGSIAIVHDWLTSMRGGERVLESLCGLYPDADLYTLRYDRDRVSPAIARHRVQASFIDRLARAPFVAGRFRGLLPLFPLAVGSFDLSRYELVISSSHCVALGARAARHALHVAYVHSPMRYAWEGEAEYATRVPGGALGRAAFAGAARLLRAWDARAAARPHALLANSSYTRDRIRRYYGRDAEVIEPPIDTERFTRGAAAGAEPDPGAPDAPFLVVSALVPYKRVELAVRAMSGRAERLVVVGEGPDRQRLARLAGPNVELRGRVGDAELDALYAGCRALLHPALDDFGIVMVEALAAGKPVVACAEGGAGDIVRDGETGVLAAAPTVEGVRAALDRFARLAGDRTRFAPERLRASARRFDGAVFARRFRDAVARAAEQRRVTATVAAPAPADIELAGAAP